METQRGDKVFTFKVSLNPETHFEAKAGSCTDAATLHKVDTPNPAYKLTAKSSNSANWV